MSLIEYNICLYSSDEMVCTKTLYNYANLGLLPIENIDLPEKLKRNIKILKHSKKQKKTWQKH